jgi:UDP-glucose 4-epimerase
LVDYAKAFGLKSVTLRYFNAAGCDPQSRIGERHNPETHIIPLVLAEALRVKKGGNPTETKLIVFGADYLTNDGSCVRDYIHVDDLCRAHLLAGKRLLDGKSEGAEYYNLANGKGFSVIDVIETIRKITGQPIEYRVGPRRIGDPPELIGDAQNAAAVLGWRPQVTSLEEITKTAWNWILTNA